MIGIIPLAILFSGAAGQNRIEPAYDPVSENMSAPGYAPEAEAASQAQNNNRVGSIAYAPGAAEQITNYRAVRHRQLIQIRSLRAELAALMDRPVATTVFPRYGPIPSTRSAQQAEIRALTAAINSNTTLMARLQEAIARRRR